MKLPDWLVYAAVIGALAVAASWAREDVYTPPAPPPPGEAEGALLGPVTPFDAAVTVNAPDIPFQPAAGTAFSIAGEGRWVTARHVVEG
ncbi:MAG: serine protease, partial [Alphaproteobacteria bacterium]|nr:serine protease [Alphaproteobacteria bacterium]